MSLTSGMSLCWCWAGEMLWLMCSPWGANGTGLPRMPGHPKKAFLATRVMCTWVLWAVHLCYCPVPACGQHWGMSCHTLAS